MNESRSLAEIARGTIQIPDGAIPPVIIDMALVEAGFDKHNEIERQRFRRLVHANDFNHEVIRNIDDFRDSAMEAAGPTAPDSEIFAIAWNMKEDSH